MGTWKLLPFGVVALSILSAAAAGEDTGTTA